MHTELHKAHVFKLKTPISNWNIKKNLFTPLNKAKLSPFPHIFLIFHKFSRSSSVFHHLNNEKLLISLIRKKICKKRRHFLQHKKSPGLSSEAFLAPKAPESSTKARLLEEHRRPTRVLGTHVNLVEVAFEAAIVHAVHLHHMAGNPLAEFKNGEFLAETALAVAVHDIRESRGREDFVNSRAVELFTGFGAGMEVRDTEADAVGISLLDVFAALHNRRTGADHVVKHNHILTLNFFDADVTEFRVEGHADFTFAGTDLVHHHALAFRKLECIVNSVHERASALIRGDNHEVVAILAGLNKVAVLDVVSINIGRNQVVEVTFENVVKEVLNLDRVVVASDHGIDTGFLQKFGVEEAREGLAIELLQVRDATVFFKVANAMRAAVLGAVEEVRFNENDLFGTIILSSASQDAVAHSIVVTAAFVVRNGANQDYLAFQTVADMFHVFRVQHIAGAEFGVGESLQGDHVGNIFTEADVLSHVNSKRVVGEVTSHDKTI